MVFIELNMKMYHTIDIAMFDSISISGWELFSPICFYAVAKYFNLLQNLLLTNHRSSRWGVRWRVCHQGLAAETCWAWRNSQGLGTTQVEFQTGADYAKPEWRGGDSSWERGDKTSGLCLCSGLGLLSQGCLSSEPSPITRGRQKGFLWLLCSLPQLWSEAHSCHACVPIQDDLVPHSRHLCAGSGTWCWGWTVALSSYVALGKWLKFSRSLLAYLWNSGKVLPPRQS